MRVVSLVPAGTEMVAAIGAAGSLVGISHECDWPPAILHLPRLTTTPIDSRAGSADIDAAVRSARAAGRAVISVDAGALVALHPDLILTQDLCEVCAVVDGGLRSIAQAIDPAPASLALKARTLPGIFEDITAVGRALDLADDAEELVEGLRYRLRRIRSGPAPSAPRVICLEWLDPIYLAGHWVPEMIEAAGGRDAGATPGSHSRTVPLAEVRAAAPDLLVAAPCGFGLTRAAEEYGKFETSLRARGEAPPSSWGIPVWLMDGNAYTSRPGPRVVDGAARFAAAIRGQEMSGLRRFKPDHETWPEPPGPRAKA